MTKASMMLPTAEPAGTGRHRALLGHLSRLQRGRLFQVDSVQTAFSSVVDIGCGLCHRQSRHGHSRPPAADRDLARRLRATSWRCRTLRSYTIAASLSGDGKGKCLDACDRRLGLGWMSAHPSGNG